MCHCPHLLIAVTIVVVVVVIIVVAHRKASVPPPLSPPSCRRVVIVFYQGKSGTSLTAEGLLNYALAKAGAEVCTKCDSFAKESGVIHGTQKI